MKKSGFLCGLLLSASLILAGCQDAGRPEALIPDEVESLTVTHYLAGKEEKAVIEGAALEGLRGWASSLAFSGKAAFEEGRYPGQNEEGGEIYDFDLGGGYPPRSYRNFGGCYIVIGGEWYPVSNPSAPPLVFPAAAAPAAAPLVMVNDKLYFDTGRESTLYPRRCGMMDGEITSAVEGAETPAENGQSNFGAGFGYQYGKNNTIEVYMHEKWHVFEQKNPDDELIRFQNRWVNKAALSRETLEWLARYGALSQEEQLSISFIPQDLLEKCGLARTEEADTRAREE